jgi:hypothetical protein
MSLWGTAVRTLSLKCELLKFEPDTLTLPYSGAIKLNIDKLRVEVKSTGGAAAPVF